MTPSGLQRATQLPLALGEQMKSVEFIIVGNDLVRRRGANSKYSNWKHTFRFSHNSMNGWRISVESKRMGGVCRHVLAIRIF